LSGKLRRHSSVFSSRLKTNSDEADVTSAVQVLMLEGRPGRHCSKLISPASAGWMPRPDDLWLPVQAGLGLHAELFHARITTGLSQQLHV